MLEVLERIERHAIARDELEQLGHRVIYDPQTGLSTNLPGVFCNPRLVDPETGYQVRMELPAKIAKADAKTSKD